MYSGTGDYLIVVNEDGEIDSRWFILENKKERSGQYTCVLHRDVVVDYYNKIIYAPTFIEKGMLEINDDAIFNPEKMTYSQVKKELLRIKDQTQTAWVVGYIARPKDNEDLTVTTGAIDYLPSWNVETISDFIYYQYVSSANAVKSRSGLTAAIAFDNLPTSDLSKAYSINWSYGSRSGVHIKDFDYYFNGYTTESYREGIPVRQTIANQIYEKTPSRLVEDAYNACGYGQNTTLVNSLKSLDGEVIFCRDTTTYYKISYNESEESKTITTSITDYGPLFEDFQTVIYNLRDFITDGSYVSESFGIKAYATTSFLTLHEISIEDEGVTFTLPTTRNELSDAPYCMFCMPYSDGITIRGSGIDPIESSAQNALYLATAIAEQLGDNLYDIQLLPYCPIAAVRNNMDAFGFDLINLDRYRINKDYTFIPLAKQVIFWAKESSGSVIIDTGFLDPYYNTDSPIDFKIGSETQVCRLCSPNYNGIFEFSQYKNRGVSSWKIDYTYKPFTPYIHVCPDFGGLYGRDFGDARGLVVSGDFSLPTLSVAWINYENNNKNYQVMFNRQIENLLTTQDIARKQEAWGAAAGTFQGIVSGATAGGFIGGGVGAAIGGIAGGIASGAAGALDIHYNELLRNEAIDYTKDQYNAQMQNIKAIPDSLTRVSAFNVNNKIFPFLEVYTATAIEEEALRNKIKYNGMTVNRIDQIVSFIKSEPSYIKGKIIRLDSLGEDSHTANAIAEEIYKGVFI